MTSTSIISLVVIIFSVILLDVFCEDPTNSRQTSRQRSPEILSNGKSTTPWPQLGQRQNAAWGRNSQASRATTSPPRKWIQQNNIWIRNEQAASSGSVTPPPNPNSNKQGNNGSKQLVGTNTNSMVQQNRGGSQQSIEGQQISSGVSKGNGNTRVTAKPQIHQTNKQQALINGLSDNHQNLLPVSTTAKSNVNPSAHSTKPMSYANALGQKNPASTSPNVPKTPNVFAPTSPLGESKKPTISTTGKTSTDEDGNPDISSTNQEVSDEELREFSEMLLRKDSNNAMKYVTLNLQGMTTSRKSNDAAPLPLMKIDQQAYKIPSIEKIVLLYNNYFLDSSQNEVYTGQERIEENNLLDTVLATPVMQFARSFLIKKGKLGRDPKEFKDLLRLIWFNMYSRGQGRIGSSGFEHIFLAEIKNNKVSGLHNWLYFNEEESQNRANYLGYMKKIDLGDKGAIVKYHFTFHDIDKPVGSMFIGTSPELELALYSTCFVLRADRICPLKMNGSRFIIRTYTYRYRGKNMIGSAFPEI